MDSNQLEKQLILPFTRVRMMKLAELCKQEQSVVSYLLEISSFHKDSQVASRAAWLLELLVFSSLFSIDDQILFLEYYPLQKSNSCQRHYTKLMMLLIKTKTLPTNYNLSAIINQTMEWLAEKKVSIAVKANCMEILYYFRYDDDGIEGELKLQIEFLMKDGSAGIHSRGRKFLSLLNQE